MSKQSFIYAGEQKTIVEAGLDLPIEKVSGNPEVLISNLNWKSNAEFQRPILQTRDVNSSIGADGRTTVTGLLVNPNSFGFTRIEIAAAAETADALTVGISETVIRDILPFEERAFTVIIPSLSVPAKNISKNELFIEAFR